MTRAKPIDVTKFDEAFFWSKVYRTDDCWNWNGARDVHGYGYATAKDGTGFYFTHRIALALFGIPLDPTLVIDHLCRNHACCNPAHLEQVTNRENIRRGDSHYGAAMRAREHGYCLNGHDLAQVGLYTAATATICKQCARDNGRRQRERKRAMGDTDTRTVHAGRADGCQVVRYDRASKWFLEWPPERGIRRRRITVAQAAAEALLADREPGGYVARGRYGGQNFDALFNRLSTRTDS